MTLVCEKIKLTPKDIRTHKYYDFYLEEDYSELRISLSYAPLDVGKEISQKESLKAMEKYVPEKFRSDEMVEDIKNTNVQNFITVSVVHDGIYLGCRHNKDSNKKVIISKNESCLGYIKHKITKGHYKVSLNCQVICSNVNAEIKIEVLK